MKRFLLILLVLLPSFLFSQITDITISGKVTSKADGIAIPGVLVVAKGTTYGSYTDIGGNYSIVIPPESKVLVFSLPGLKTHEEEIKNRTHINVAMESDNKKIEEIVTTGLNIQKEEKYCNYAGDELFGSDRSILKGSGANLDGGISFSEAYYDDGDNGNNTEEYSNITENEYKNVFENPVSTFSIDVDNASYSNVRRFLNNNQMPPNDAVRIEEMINYFDYDYKEPKGETPFSFVTEISDAPWNIEHKLIHIGIQGKKIDYEDLKPSNLVFLVDVSGSMSSANKLPLLVKSLKMLVRGLSKKDHVSLVVYAGAAGVVLESTSASDTTTIFEALDRLKSGGSTAGGAGVTLAYNICQKNLIQDGNNRVILATDGDFNVGTSSTGALVDLITEYRQKYDIYLTICGFGMGNYKDDKMEEISNAGNGNYFYIDNEAEAEKVFVKDLRANMFTIAKDVKIQIEFNPAEVKAYRLIGYENRILAKEDFDNDKKDAGELGAGHTVTAIYEIIPANSDEEVQKVGDLKYQQTGITNEAKKSGEIMTLKFRYKPIHSEKSILIEEVVKASDYKDLSKTSDAYKFSAAVASFGMLLRESKFIENYSYDDVLELAKSSYNKDDQYQEEFIQLVERAKTLAAMKSE
ncbi:MAG: von Willebrand factor type A domain-containing protein [Bacteroidales bacterium]|nr:von Willebrand factor type A domain-containing protein [Bacteroidales bacterium]